MAKRQRCSTAHCRNFRAKGRTICNGCKTRRYRENNPVQAAYQALKDNAKRRGHIFSLTPEEFMAFCVKTKVLHGRGRTSASFHIDRIEDHKGYEVDNLQVLTCRQNVLKELDRRRAAKLLASEEPAFNQIKAYDWQTKEGYYIFRDLKPAPDTECPF